MTVGIQRIYVLSSIPLDSRGKDSRVWGRDWDALVSPTKLRPGHHIQITTLDLPSTLTDEEITNFLASVHGSQLVDPTDPMGRVTGAILRWRTLADMSLNQALEKTRPPKWTLGTEVVVDAWAACIFSQTESPQWLTAMVIGYEPTYSKVPLYRVRLTDQRVGHIPNMWFIVFEDQMKLDPEPTR